MPLAFAGWPAGAQGVRPQRKAIMKASKFIVLVGGILGILAFFLPIVTVHRRGVTASVSAFQVVKGLDTASVAVDDHADGGRCRARVLG